MDLESLKKQIEAFKLPPVDSWNPEFCADIGLKIKKDGTWWQNDEKFTRQSLIELFSKILRKDRDGLTYLVTPYEKVSIFVEDAHFIGKELFVTYDGNITMVHLKTNINEIIAIDKSLKIWLFNKNENDSRVYLEIRGGLKIMLNRSAYYDLMELCQIKGNSISFFSFNHEIVLGEIE